MGITTMAMITTSMSTPTELLQLLWLASPALPVGAFSYSEGLEAAVDSGLVHDEATAGDWLLNQLELVQARAELPLMAAVFRADGDAELQRLNTWVLQTRESAELLQQCTQMGRSLGAWMGGQGLAVPVLTPPTWPVLYACAAKARGAGLEATLHAAAFAWAENLVMAAVRSVPLGQSAGQRLIGRLVEAIPGAVQTALDADEPIAFSPGLAVLSARHETQYSRLFRS